MSGMTRSMPSISSSGNMRPASMTTMSSPDSSASMFFPISPTPPSGMTRSGLAKERDLLRRLLHLFGLGLGSGRSREVEGERGEVREERVAKRGLVERRRPDEGLPLDVLVVPGGLAEEEQAGLAGAVAGHGLTSASVERAGPARTDLGGDGVQVHRDRIVHRA